MGRKRLLEKSALRSCVDAQLSTTVEESKMGNETKLLEIEEESSDNVASRARKLKEKSPTCEFSGNNVNFGLRTVVTNPVSSCDRLDKMFGSGGEAIVHYMWFESGYSLFDSMVRCNDGKSAEELLRALVDAQPHMGWGEVILNVIQKDPPSLNIVVKDPPVKTMKGSQKQMIGSFWAGVFSRCFDKQLTCKNFNYDAQKDELTCAITI